MNLKNTQIFSFMHSKDHVLPLKPQLYTKDLGKLLKSLMKEQSITGQQLADRVGLNPASVSKILSGHSNPRVKTLNRLAKALARNPMEEQEIVQAYHGARAPAGTELSPFDRAAYYSHKISEEAWAAKAQVVKVMEHRAHQANFRMVIESALIDLKIDYQKDYAHNGAATDFLLTFPDGFTIAIESRAEIHRNLAQTFGFAYLVLERMDPDQVLIVTPYPANITRPEDMPEPIWIVSFEQMRSNLSDLKEDHKATE
jgi:transcriptional regulator with XRE-family HTH domain